VAEGYAALERYEADIRTAAREVLEQLAAAQRPGVVVPGGPAHNDPGVSPETPPPSRL